jgi:hypothetical protein
LKKRLRRLKARPASKMLWNNIITDYRPLWITRNFPPHTGLEAFSRNLLRERLGVAQVNENSSDLQALQMLRARARSGT